MRAGQAEGVLLIASEHDGRLNKRATNITTISALLILTRLMEAFFCKTPASVF